MEETKNKMKTKTKKRQQSLYDKAARKAGLTNGQMKLSQIAKEPAGVEYIFR